MQAPLFPYLDCPVCNTVTEWQQEMKDGERGYQCTCCRLWRSGAIFQKLYNDRVNHYKRIYKGKRHVSQKR